MYPGPRPRVAIAFRTRLQVPRVALCHSNLPQRCFMSQNQDQDIFEAGLQRNSTISQRILTPSCTSILGIQEICLDRRSCMNDWVYASGTMPVTIRSPVRHREEMERSSHRYDLIIICINWKRDVSEEAESFEVVGWHSHAGKQQMATTT